MSRPMWKDFERAVAAYFHAKRIPVMGQEPDGADAESHCGRFGYQCKRIKTLPGYLIGWLVGIRRTASAKGRVGLVVAKLPGDDTADALVILAAEDWRRILDLLDAADAVAPIYRQLVDQGLVEPGARVDRARLSAYITVTRSEPSHGSGDAGVVSE